MTPTLQRLTAQGRALVQRFKPQSASVRNVLKLAGGTAGSQMITVAAAPILTRLYGPESFGVLATFASFLALLNVVSSLRYELAIAVPEDDAEAIALVWLCFALVAISTALTALGVALLGNQLVGWLQQPALKPLLWLLPVGVLLSGVYQPLSYWAIRRKQFGLLAQTKLRQSIVGTATNLAAAPLGAFGLLFGYVLSQSLGAVSIFRNLPNPFSTSLQVSDAASGQAEDRFAFSPVSNSCRVASRFREFSFFSISSGMVIASASQLPVLLLSSAYGPDLVGGMALINKVSLTPLLLISTSVGQVLRGSARDDLRSGILLKKINKLTLRLLGACFLVLIPWCLFLYIATPLLLGEKWISQRYLIPLLLPAMFGQIIVSPLTVSFGVAGRMKEGLVANMARALIAMGALLTCIFIMRLDSVGTVAIVSTATALGYFVYLMLMRRILA